MREASSNRSMPVDVEEEGKSYVFSVIDTTEMYKHP